MTTVRISEYLSANVKGSKIINQQITEQKITPGVKHEITFFITISASSGESIRSKPDLFLNAIYFDPKTFSSGVRIVESSELGDRIPSLIIETESGLIQTRAGDLNSFDNYPILLISGFLHFIIPLNGNEQLGAPVLKIRNQ